MNTQPVYANGGLAVILAFLAPLLVRWGLTTDDVTEIAGIATGVIAGVVSLIQIVVAHGKVTPLARPRDNAGRVLGPVDEGGSIDVAFLMLATVFVAGLAAGLVASVSSGVAPVLVALSVVVVGQLLPRRRRLGEWKSVARAGGAGPHY